MLFYLSLILAAAIILHYFWCRQKGKSFRFNLLYSPRLSDAAYIEKIPAIDQEKNLGLAMRIRTAFGGIARLPRECISPEMSLADVISAKGYYLSDRRDTDGMDTADLLIELEDLLKIEIPENTGLRFSLNDTVANLTAKLCEHWQEFKEVTSGDPR